MEGTEERQTPTLWREVWPPRGRYCGVPLHSALALTRVLLRSRIWLPTFWLGADMVIRDIVFFGLLMAEKVADLHAACGLD
jgi:hypothetical protein